MTDYTECNSDRFVKWQIQCTCDLEFYKAHSKTCTMRFKLFVIKGIEV